MLIVGVKACYAVQTMMYFNPPPPPPPNTRKSDAVKCYVLLIVSVLLTMFHFPSVVSVKPILNWANVCSPEHTSDTSMNYDLFLN